MAKSSNKPATNGSKNTYLDITTESSNTTLSALRQDSDLWYRIHVLLYDLSNVANLDSQKRISLTVHELYISDPYFSELEAIRIRTALIDTDHDTSGDGTYLSSLQGVTIEEAIHHKLADFLDKRKASGDARPCGPHDIVPIYSDIFKIGKDELKDERFLSRMRRSGLRDAGPRPGVKTVVEGTGKTPGKGQKGKGKKRR
ncbi:MAG: hypothetical protein Q9163_006173 [Psora crenata]